MKLSKETNKRIQEAIKSYPVKRSAVLPLLHLVQDDQGYLSDEALEWIASKLKLEPINVYELITFYPMLRRKPLGKKQVRVCRTLSCALRGAYRTCHALEDELGCKEGEVSEDGSYSIEFVECQASCGTGPVVLVNESTYENVEGEKALKFAQSLKQGTLDTDSDFTSYEEKVEGGIFEPHDKTPRSAPREKKIIMGKADSSGYRNDLRTYLKNGGYKILGDAVKRKPEDLCAEVEMSGVRGRGGAGFPAGMKWKFLDRRSGKPIYLICNADESEPGTFKDRQIIYKDPHQLIEGMMIAAYAIQAKLAFIYIRGEFFEGARILERAIAEAKAKGFVGDGIAGSKYSCEIVVHRGAGAYICGEETGLIESLEGKRPYPRIKPPYFPAALGLYQCPTIVNNVETLCNVRHIVEMGGSKYANLGHAGNTGTRIWCVSGQVKRPGYYEFENGAVTLGQLIYDVCGGLLPGRTLKAVIPGGSSAKVLRAGERYQGRLKDGTEFDWSLEDVPLDFDGPMAAGSMSGSGGIIVMDDGVDMVEALANLSAFYAHESCGQCTPCREGSLWLKKVTARMMRGGARDEDPDLLLSIANQIEGRTICAFGEACAWPVQSFVSKFKEDFASKARQSEAEVREPFAPGSEKVAK